MSEKARSVLEDMNFPENIIEVVLKISQNETEAVNLAIQYVEKPETIPNLEEQEIKKTGQYTFQIKFIEKGFSGNQT